MTIKHRHKEDATSASLPRNDELTNEQSEDPEQLGGKIGQGTNPPAETDSNAQIPLGEDDARKAVVGGEMFEKWPQNLYIPPEALEVVLESFQGPLDLLLYLIRRQNLDILNIPVAEITRQYMRYVEAMHKLKLDLAAEYLVMAAMLAEIKSRMLLPRPQSEDEDGEDPRAALVRRLQEYERFREASTELDQRPRIDRDLFIASVNFEDTPQIEKLPDVSLDALTEAFRGVVELAAHKRSFFIEREALSVRERMTSILDLIRTRQYANFVELFDLDEGRTGLVVSFVAILELCKDNMLVVTQTEPFAPIHVKAAA